MRVVVLNHNAFVAKNLPFFIHLFQSYFLRKFSIIILCRSFVNDTYFRKASMKYMSADFFAAIVGNLQFF